jgi:nucleotide-binding universal stress UspA family protein
VELVVRCGRAASIMRDEAGSASVIVVGPHDPDTRADALRSDFTAKVLSEVRRPMLIVRRPANQPYGRLLLALDGSRATGQVVRMAERLPMADDAALAVVHAHEPPYEAMMTTAGVGNLNVASYSSASMQQAASRIQAQLRLHSRDARRYRVLLMDARPAPAIREVIRETRPDLLVLGTRGHGRLRRALLGSTAHEVLQSVDCDVLVVPEAFQDTTRPDHDPGARAA